MSDIVGGVPRSSFLRAGDPTEFGPYQVIGRLGEGGMGSVFLAMSPEGHRVALKVIRDDLAHDDEFRRRFRSEVARARQVPPFCTAEVLDADTEHEPPYLVVEYVDGPSLAVVVRERGPLTPANQHGLAVGVAVALTAIHGAGVIHRDLKPSNVLLAPGSPKVIDFGIARDVANAASETRTDQLVGTVAYMAPERFGGKSSGPLTPASDIFAWGAVVAFSATGDSPFSADVPAAIAVRIMSEPPNLDGVPRPLRDLVANSLAKNPADRPTARELLDHLLGGSTTVVPPPVAAQETFALQTEVLAAAGIRPPQPMYPPQGPTQRRPLPPRDMPTRRPGPAPRPRPAPPPPRRGGTGVIITLLSMLVLLLAGTIVAVATGYLKLPGLETPPAAGPTNPAKSPVLEESPAPSGPEPTASLIASPTATAVNDPTLIPGSVVVFDATFPANGAYWTPTTLPEVGGKCTVDGSLTVSLSQTVAGSYRCRGISNQFTDFTVKVDAEFADRNSCAGIWFRFTDSIPGGYAVKICRDGVTLVNHTGNKITTIKVWNLSLAPNVSASYAIRAKGNSISVFRDGTMLGTVTDNTFDRGRIVLGVLAYDGTSPAPYEATFHRIQILEPR